MSADPLAFLNTDDDFLSDDDTPAAPPLHHQQHHQQSNIYAPSTYLPPDQQSLQFSSQLQPSSGPASLIPAPGPVLSPVHQPTAINTSPGKSLPPVQTRNPPQPAPAFFEELPLPKRAPVPRHHHHYQPSDSLPLPPPIGGPQSAYSSPDMHGRASPSLSGSHRSFDTSQTLPPPPPRNLHKATSMSPFPTQSDYNAMQRVPSLQPHYPPPPNPHRPSVSSVASYASQQQYAPSRQLPFSPAAAAPAAQFPAGGHPYYTQNAPHLQNQYSPAQSQGSYYDQQHPSQSQQSLRPQQSLHPQQPSHSQPNPGYVPRQDYGASRQNDLSRTASQQSHLSNVYHGSQPHQPYENYGYQDQYQHNDAQKLHQQHPNVYPQQFNPPEANNPAQGQVAPSESYNYPVASNYDTSVQSYAPALPQNYGEMSQSHSQNSQPPQNQRHESVRNGPSSQSYRTDSYPDYSQRPESISRQSFEQNAGYAPQQGQHGMRQNTTITHSEQPAPHEQFQSQHFQPGQPIPESYNRNSYPESSNLVQPQGTETASNAPPYYPEQAPQESQDQSDFFSSIPHAGVSPETINSSSDGKTGQPFQENGQRPVFSQNVPESEYEPEQTHTMHVQPQPRYLPEQQYQQYQPVNSAAHTEQPVAHEAKKAQVEPESYAYPGSDTSRVEPDDSIYSRASNASVIYNPQVPVNGPPAPATSQYAPSNVPARAPPAPQGQYVSAEVVSQEQFQAPLPSANAHLVPGNPPASHPYASHPYPQDANAAALQPGLPQQHATPYGQPQYQVTNVSQQEQAPAAGDAQRRQRSLGLCLWSPNGCVVSIIPTSDALASESSTITIANASKYVQLPEAIGNFPGPLVNPASKPGNKNIAKSVSQWIQTRVSYLEIESRPYHGDFKRQANDKILLYKLMQVLVDIEGKIVPQTLSSTDLIPKLRDALVGSNIQRDGMLPANRLGFIQQQTPRSDLSATTILEALNTGGGKSVVELALAHGNWAHALLFGSTLGKEEWSRVLNEFADKEVLKNPSDQNSRILSLLYKIMAGTAENLLRDETRESLDMWPQLLFSIVSTCFFTSASSIKLLGDKLMESDRPYAAAACYLFVFDKITIGGVLDTTEPDFSFVGATNAKNAISRFANDIEGMCLTEIAEYIKFASSENPASKEWSHLVWFKYQHAMILLDHGLVPEASRYLSNISASFRAAPRGLNPYLTARFFEIVRTASELLAEKAADANSGWFRPSFGNLLNHFDKSFTKFVAGDSEIENDRKGAADERFVKVASNTNLSRMSSIADISARRSVNNSSVPPYRTSPYMDSGEFPAPPGHHKPSKDPSSASTLRGTYASSANEHINFPAGYSASTQTPPVPEEPETVSPATKVQRHESLRSSPGGAEFTPAARLAPSLQRNIMDDMVKNNAAQEQVPATATETGQSYAEAKPALSAPPHVLSQASSAMKETQLPPQDDRYGQMPAPVNPVVPPPANAVKYAPPLPQSVPSVPVSSEPVEPQSSYGGYQIPSYQPPSYEEPQAQDDAGNDAEVTSETYAANSATLLRPEEDGEDVHSGYTPDESSSDSESSNSLPVDTTVDVPNYVSADLSSKESSIRGDDEDSDLNAFVTNKPRKSHDSDDERDQHEDGDRNKDDKKGWFPWKKGEKKGEKKEEEKRVYKAVLGSENKMVYDKEKKKWINPDCPEDEHDAPPPPPPKRPGNTHGSGVPASVKAKVPAPKAQQPPMKFVAPMPAPIPLPELSEDLPEDGSAYPEQHDDGSAETQPVSSPEVEQLNSSQYADPYGNNDRVLATGNNNGNVPGQSGNLPPSANSGHGYNPYEPEAVNANNETAVRTVTRTSYAPDTSAKTELNSSYDPRRDSGGGVDAYQPAPARPESVRAYEPSVASGHSDSYNPTNTYSPIGGAESADAHNPAPVSAGSDEYNSGTAGGMYGPPTTDYSGTDNAAERQNPYQPSMNDTPRKPEPAASINVTPAHNISQAGLHAGQNSASKVYTSTPTAEQQVEESEISERVEPVPVAAPAPPAPPATAVAPAPRAPPAATPLPRANNRASARAKMTVQTGPMSELDELLASTQNRQPLRRRNVRQKYVDILDS
ncbi:hypothetical protein CANCADRAFT_46149 [Tortispora caseinolytica NRRL Y-17796]|uniref:Protein transport protein sec16 n=1 Tax=Tortispora caseinolytica NRRL Y-17796 TaxID=767744 RepID=A0A1E4TDF3_9ASCO|nr:hypothetical protein CANCADRAFT_46149 [Tortispora caseinolytica NRRL Y-17796]